MIKISKITFGKNYSKYAVANISIQFEGGISLYGVEVKESKEGKLFLSHQVAYKDKEGKTGFSNQSFISQEIADEVIKTITPKLSEGTPATKIEVK